MAITNIYYPKGVCSRRIEVTVEGDRIESVNIVGGCDGNAKGLTRLLEGMEVCEAVRRLRGITCDHKPTSCPDQTAIALAELLEKEGRAACL